MKNLIVIASNVGNMKKIYNYITANKLDIYFKLTFGLLFGLLVIAEKTYNHLFRWPDGNVSEIHQIYNMMNVDCFRVILNINNSLVKTRH